MTTLIPNRVLFDFEFRLAYRRRLPELTGRLADWTDAERLPDLGAIDGRPASGEVWACWSETGLAVACRVTGRKQKLQCDPKVFWKGDNLRVCTDMRDTRNIKRASRHCQQFYFLPTGGGRQGREPAAGSAPLLRARENAPPTRPEQIPVAAEVSASGYQLEAHLPAEILAGFDPAEHPRIGFFYILEDREKGQQYLTVGDDLLWFVDPSSWATAVLAR